MDRSLAAKWRGGVVRCEDEAVVRLRERWVKPHRKQHGLRTQNRSFKEALLRFAINTEQAILKATRQVAEVGVCKRHGEWYEAAKE